MKLFRIKEDNKEISTDSMIKLDREIDKRNRGLAELSRIVGGSPLTEIDYIIEHGFDDYIKLYKSALNGEILFRKRMIRFDDDNFDSICYARGGIGNSILVTFSNSES